MKTRHFRLKPPAMFHASQSSSWCGAASVIRSQDGWEVVKCLSPDAAAIFYWDYLVYSDDPEDRPQNYFGFICESVQDVIEEVNG